MSDDLKQPEPMTWERYQALIDTSPLEFEAAKEAWHARDPEITDLKEHLEILRHWVNCGGVPTGHKCSVDGHEIYGACMGDGHGNFICECHEMQRFAKEIATLTEKLRVSEAACAEMRKSFQAILDIRYDHSITSTSSLQASTIAAKALIKCTNPGQPIIDQLKAGDELVKFSNHRPGCKENLETGGCRCGFNAALDSYNATRGTR